MQTPHDSGFKNLAEDHPELLFRLLRIPGFDGKALPISLPRELHLDPVQVDHLYRVGEGDAERIVHLEAITSWNPKRIPLMALYNFLTKHKYKLPVSSYIVLMAEKYAPKVMPPRVIYEEDDGFRIEAPYKVIRLWELHPGIAFEPGCEALLPWVPLLKGGVPELERAGSAIARLLDSPSSAPYPIDAMVNNLVSLATLRYHKDVVGHFLEGLKAKIMISPEVFHVSWLYQDGLAAGQAKGELGGKRSALLLALKAKFPALAITPNLEQINRSELLDQLLVAVLTAQTADELQAAFQSALRPN